MGGFYTKFSTMSPEFLICTIRNMKGGPGWISYSRTGTFYAIVHKKHKMWFRPDFLFENGCVLN